MCSLMQVGWVRSFFVAISLFFCAGSIHGDALDHWHWRNPSPPLTPLVGIAYGQGTFIAVGGWQGTILSSPDGTNWSHETSANEEFLFGVTFVNNLWIAVGAGGSLLTSP